VTDEQAMQLALEEARASCAAEEVPVGAVLVKDGTVIGRGQNRTTRDCDPTAHAEVIAIREAARALQYERVGGTLYVTLEPCPMCKGMLTWARVDRVVYGAADPDGGAPNHRYMMQQGHGAEESARMLKDFFKQARLGAKGLDGGL